MLGLLAPAGAAQAQTTYSYTFTGSTQTYTVPAGVTSLRVVATGASGGLIDNPYNFTYS